LHPADCGDADDLHRNDPALAMVNEALTAIVGCQYGAILSFGAPSPLPSLGAARRHCYQPGKPSRGESPNADRAQQENRGAVFGR
jgi:hypothetical protein